MSSWPPSQGDSGQSQRVAAHSHGDLLPPRLNHSVSAVTTLVRMVMEAVLSSIQASHQGLGVGRACLHSLHFHLVPHFLALKGQASLGCSTKQTSPMGIWGLAEARLLVAACFLCAGLSPADR